MSRLRDAIAQLKFTRRYTVGFLDTIPETEWFHMPHGVTHVAWQVGHLAFAEYRLCLDRLRGERAEDDAFVSPAFLATFARDSVVNADPAEYPAVSEIRRTFDAVHEYALSEIAMVPEGEFDTAMLKPHKFCRTKLDCLIWCSQHEMLHAGQIALLRRLFGQKPIW